MIGCWHRGALWVVWKPTCTSAFLLLGWGDGSWGDTGTTQWPGIKHTHFWAWVYFSITWAQNGIGVLVTRIQWEVACEAYGMVPKCPPRPFYRVAAAGTNMVPSARWPHSSIYLHSCQDRQTKVYLKGFTARLYCCSYTGCNLHVHPWKLLPKLCYT